MSLSFINLRKFKALAGDKAAIEKPATDEAAASGKATQEPVICCEFGGATGTSTKTACLEYQGKVVEGLLRSSLTCCFMPRCFSPATTS